MKYASCLALLALATSVAACSPPADTSATNSDSAATSPVQSPRQPAPSAAAEPEGDGDGAAQARVLGLSGLGALKVGEVVPHDGTWSGGAEASGADCNAVNSAACPGVYALVEGGKVRRITVGPGSDVKLAEGVGIGSPETEVRKWFAGFHSEPHKYEDAPAKYLTAPNAASGSSALRLEIGADGKVKAMHVGLMPQLEYVEGCG